MARRQVNPNRVKIHRTYSVEEVATLLEVHEHTVRNWQKSGLVPIDDQRPTLFKGSQLKAYLQNKRKSKQQPCTSHEMYCLKCRAPRRPAGDVVDYLPITGTSGNLRGLCPECETLMHRRTSQTKLEVLEQVFDIAYPQDAERLSERGKASLNCDST